MRKCISHDNMETLLTASQEKTAGATTLPQLD